MKQQHREFDYESIGEGRFRNIDRTNALSLSTRVDEKNHSNDLGWPEFSDVEKTMIRLIELQNKLNLQGNSSSPNSVFLQQADDFYKAQLSNIISNFLFVRKGEVQGFSGYICEKCHVLEFEFVRDVGYDKIAKARHKCDLHQAKSNSTNIDKGNNTTAADELIAQQLMAFLKNLNPNIQYLIADDISKAYNIILEKFDSNLAKVFLGIGDRYFLHTLKEEDMPSWMNRVVTNLGSPILLSELEMIDFFKRTKSTFATIEILTANSIKMINVRLIIQG